MGGGGSFSPIGPNPNGRAASFPPPHTPTAPWGGGGGGGGNEAVQRRFLGRPEEAGVGLKPKGRHGARAGERR